jgi:hypothetical protein
MSAKDSKIPHKSHLVITDSRILDFYNKNTHLEIEKVNLLFIDLLENIINVSIDTPSVVNQILIALGVQNRDINNLLSVVVSTSDIHKSELSNIKNIHALTNESIRNEIDSVKHLITTKLYETKDNYIKELKDNLRNTDSNAVLHIGTTIDKNNGFLIDKIMLILNDIIPKSQNKQYEEIIKFFKDDLITSLDKIRTNNPENVIEKISSLVDTKYNNLVFNIQDHMMRYISQSEDRITNNISNIRDISSKNMTTQDKINEDITLYLNKYKVSASKGSLSENNLYNIIEKEYKSSELTNTSNLTAMGDMILKRPDKLPILIENKDYSTNVKKDEVDKFIRDITKNKYNGIFISQHSGIVGKENFQIDMHNNNILLYIHSCDYDIDKIKLAINTIDTLSDKFTDVNVDISSISKEMIKSINNDYQSFLTYRESALNILKEYHKKTLDIFTHLKLPSLEKYLSSHFADTKKNKIMCSNCKIYETDNLRSLARHTNSCNKKTTIKNEPENDNISSESNEPEQIITPIIKKNKSSKSKDITC